MTHQLRMPECKIGGMESTKAGPSYGHLLVTVMVPDRIDDFFFDKFVIPDVIFHPIRRLDVPVVPAVCIDAVRTINLDKTLLQKPSGRFDELKILTLMIATLGAWENDDWMSGMTEYQHFNLFAEIGRVPF